MKFSINTTLSRIVIVGSAMFAASSVFASDGKVLTDNQGMTLYTFDKDKKGESVCYDGCAAKWPPYVASEYAKGKRGFKVITRKDGTKQWAYKNKPLYTWVGDSAQGDTTGDGVGGVWHTAKKKSGYSASAYQDTSSSDSNY